MTPDCPELCTAHDLVEATMTRLEAKVDKLLDLESTRAAACAGHGERIKHLEESDRDQWRVLSDLRKHIYVGIGVALAAQFGVVLLLKALKVL